jgi:hypothetical protein
MTDQEAISQLKDLYNGPARLTQKQYMALDKAIEALKLAICVDAVSDSIGTQDFSNSKNYTRCLRCNRTLKDPISQERGYGEICWKKHMLDTQQTLF